ncbi:uncharacterized protein [Eurosta solidaginis]|uniref:uncharacterized protein isoform X2 n=1 Tax=Eurosta solidaginis TaxID=178769 RepID=UPI003530570F
MGDNGEQKHAQQAYTHPTSVSHPLQDVALDVTDDAAAAKQNWVKFDDEEAENKNTYANDSNGEGNAAIGINPTANSGRDDLVTEPVSTLIETPAPANRLSPSTLLPAPPSRKQTSAATATIPITTTAAIARPRSPFNGAESGSGTETIVAVAPAPAQRATKTVTAAPPTPSMTDVRPAVLNTESTHVNLNTSGRLKVQQQQQHHTPNSAQHTVQQQQQHYHQKDKFSPSNVLTSGAANSHLQQQNPHNNGTSPSNGSGNKLAATKATTNVTIPVETAPQMRTIELSTGRIREGFANGDVIVTLLPANTKWPWITPAIFRPELVPEELMAQGLTLTVEDYVNAMETLVNDYRFTIYNICYKRILVCWIMLAFTVLLTLLFSGLQGVALFSLGVGWLFLNAMAIFGCMWMKLRLSRGLEKCLARVNRQLMKHKILLVLDDRGRISCHKVNLCFLYFDASQCVNYLNEFLEHTEQNGGESIKAGWERKLDIDVNDIVIQGSNPVRLSRKQERGAQLFLRYAERWGMEALRGILEVSAMEPGRHCRQFHCPCQYIKEHLQCKPRGYPCSCIPYASDPILRVRF